MATSSAYFEGRFRTVLFDHVGAVGSDLTAYDRFKYATLNGYAEDLVEIGRDPQLKDAIFAGHSGKRSNGTLVTIPTPPACNVSLRRDRQTKKPGSFRHRALKH